MPRKTRKAAVPATPPTDQQLAEQLETAHQAEFSAMDAQQIDIDKAVKDSDELEAAAVGFDPAKLETMMPTPVMTPVVECRAPVMPPASDRLPNQHPIDEISMDDDRNGPKMRLVRSHRPRDVWIAFDVNPGKDITDQIKAEGFRWEPRAEVNERPGAWVKPLHAGHEVRAMLDAEKLFKAVGNQIRQSKGLDPVGALGAA